MTEYAERVQAISRALSGLFEQDEKEQSRLSGVLEGVANISVHVSQQIERIRADLPGLVASDELTRDDVLNVDAFAGAHRFDLVHWPIVELNLDAARELADAIATEQAALTFARYAAWIGSFVPEVVGGALAERGLAVSDEFALEQVVPEVVINLRLIAGQALLGPDVTGYPGRGVEHLRSTLEMAGRVRSSAVDRIRHILTSIAYDIVGSVTTSSTADPASDMQRLEAAASVLDTLGAPSDALDVRLKATRLHLRRRMLRRAAETLSDQSLPSKLTPQQLTTIQLLRTDLTVRGTGGVDSLRLASTLGSTGEALLHLSPYGASIKARCLFKQGQIEAARTAFERILVMPNRSGETEAEIAAIRVEATTYLGLIALRQGDSRAAETWFEHVGRLFHGPSLLDWQRLDSLAMVASAWASEGKWQLADQALDAAIATRQRLAEATRNAMTRDEFFALWSELDAMKVRRLLALGDADGALAVIELAKGRVLRSLLGKLRQSARGSDEKLRVIASAYQELSPHDRATTGSRRRQLQSAAETIAKLARLAPQDEWAPPRGTVHDLLAASVSPSATAVVSYFTSEAGLAVVVTTQAGTEGVWLDELPYTDQVRPVFDQWVRAREAAASSDAGLDEAGDPLGDALMALYRLLIEPILPMLLKEGTRTVTFAPHRCLHAVPFPALTDDAGVPLIDEFRTVTVVPNIALGAGTLRQRDDRTTGGPVFLAVPDGNPEVPIPLTSAEVALSAAHWQDRAERLITLFGKEATPSALVDAAPKASILHIAAHGKWSGERESQSGVLLAREPQASLQLFGTHKGFLSVEAVMNLLTLERCSVTILSACETSLSRVGETDEPVGLPAFLLHAGSRHVIASLWPVLDASTLLLMVAVHERMAGGRPAAEALCDAQRWLRQLGGRDAATLLRRASRAVVKAELPREERRRASEALRAEARKARRCNTTPYSNPDHWAAFTCTGPP